MKSTTVYLICSCVFLLCDAQTLATTPVQTPKVSHTLTENDYFILFLVTCILLGTCVVCLCQMYCKDEAQVNDKTYAYVDFGSDNRRFLVDEQGGLPHEPKIA